MRLFVLLAVLGVLPLVLADLPIHCLNSQVHTRSKRRTTLTASALLAAIPLLASDHAVA